MRFTRGILARGAACFLILAAIAAAAPITFTLTGTGSGSLGGKFFNGASFTFTLTGDTNTLMPPSCCPGDIDTNSGTSNTFMISGFSSGTLNDNQVIWTDREGTLGLAHFNDGDLIDLFSTTLSGYALTSSIGPITAIPSFVGACPGVDCASFNTSLGTLMFSSVATVTFSATVTTTPTPNITAVTDQATGGTRLAPGEPILVAGSNFSTGVSDLPTVTIGNEPAPLYTLFDPSKLIAAIPYDVPVGPTTVTVTSHGSASNAFPITVSAFAPAILPGPLGSSPFYDMNGTQITSTYQAVANQQVYLVAIGLGPTNPTVNAGATVTASAPTTSAVSVSVGGVSVTPDYAGLKVGNISGDYEVLFKVPVTVVPGATPVTISVGGVTSAAATLEIGPPVPFITAIVNGATFKAKGAAANSFVSLFGVNVGGSSTSTNVFPSTSFDGISVTANGTKVPLYYVFGSSGQINLVLPSELPDSGNVTVEVSNATGASAQFQLAMAPADVGMFRIPDPSKPSRNNGAVLFANTVWRVMPVSMATAIGFPSCSKATPATVCAQPAKAKDVIEIYVTGLGKATPNGDANGKVLSTGTLAPLDGSTIYETVAKPTVTVGGVPATVGFSGVAPGNAGLYQINITIPDGVSPGDDVPIVVTMGASTDTVTIAIQAG